jgi:hypothetical protein
VWGFLTKENIMQNLTLINKDTTRHLYTFEGFYPLSNTVKIWDEFADTEATAVINARQTYQAFSTIYGA